MTKEKVRDALASVLGFKPVKRVRHKLLVISVHVLLWGLFLILPVLLYRMNTPDTGFFYGELINKSFLIVLFFINFKLAHSLYISEKQKKLLENERLNAELNFLKLQINPHFLFNTLNSIYSQAHLRSDQTEHSILKFSRIMRYVLYDSAAGKIPLSQDLEYISNYIDLQQLRLSKNISVHYDVSGPVNGLFIAPLLLITFIENAFKHGISYTAPSAINISIAVTGNTLALTVGNAIIRSNRGSTGGVGLINARRRLDVLYPGRHLLDVIENDHLYIVNLKIELDHDH
ncbi:sensor histidine kinase [Longitalea luteola]|uniref:sensor histidine kinase n=1 Tax=Longitalea luteola TaxID=2812563 RepID=UPI001A972D0D|nr:sensor histidine kinase [Longitalea luteola]